MEKRFIVAIGLSVLVLTLYPHLLNRLYPHKKISPETKPYNITSTTKPPEAKISPVSEKSNDLEGPADKEIALENKFTKVVLSNSGAAIKRIYQLNTPGLSEKELLLFDAGQGQHKGLALFFDANPLTETSYNFAKGPNRVYFNSVWNEKIFIEKTFELPEDSAPLKVDIKLRNDSGKEERFMLRVIGPPSLKSELKQDERLLEFDIKTNNSVLREPAHRLKQPKQYKGEFYWVSSKNRYFCFAVRPQEKIKEVSIEKGDAGLVYPTLSRGEIILKPGEIAEFSYEVYIGQLKLSELKKYGFSEILNFGFFDPIGKFLLRMLEVFYRVSKNYGIAVILLTILTGVALFPLSLKSLKSMKQMQKLQPHFEKLRQEHKDSPHKLNREMMELYKKHRVNPFGGCLPMLLQMPIFIALYQVIIRSVELKGAGFLWIKDLSMPDSLRLPFVLPFVGNRINLLPILMIGAMFLQQKFANPMAKTQDEQARILSFIMPIMFGVIFYNLPSALVLYWFINTVIMTTLQYIALRPVIANE